MSITRYVIGRILLLSTILLTDIIAATQDRQVYIVYMGKEAHHHNMLEEVLDGSSVQDSLVYSYRRSFNGFAAKLTPKEQQKLAGMKDVVAVFPSENLNLHTTRSWDFLGLPRTARRVPEVETDVIIGFIDSGIWPESATFNDDGIGPPPSKWNGTCRNFPCNNKIIGARYYNSDGYPGKELSARDFDGHGTHTASTAAGREVVNASFNGIARGTVRGAVPSARIAVYKVCWGEGCSEADVLAAMDDAIADGVDILSVSLGASRVRDFFRDPIAIGSFHAMKNGILTAASGGNGFNPGTLTNAFPWMLTVAASTIDRKIIDRLVIDDREIIEGFSINPYDTEEHSSPFIDGGDCASLDDSAKGKIVLCEGGYPVIDGVKGAVINGIAFMNELHSIPVIFVDVSVGERLKKYIKRSANPVAKIEKTSTRYEPKAPIVPPFSSKGPSKAVLDILKPDVCAPGFEILSAWSPKAEIFVFTETHTTSTNYFLMSGTSVSCPHAAGAAAYVKSFHRDWSPAAIMSALMTSATRMDQSGITEEEFAYGSGQIDPVAATNPGLVYDAGVDDYVLMLCSLNFTEEDLKSIYGDDIKCPKDYKGETKDLNYPSMSFTVYRDAAKTVNFTRTVTNVGAEKSVYNATVETTETTYHRRINVKIEPETLTFKSLNEKQCFVVTVSWDFRFGKREDARAMLTWSDGVHTVRSPIILHGDYFGTN